MVHRIFAMDLFLKTWTYARQQAVPIFFVDCKAKPQEKAWKMNGKCFSWTVIVVWVFFPEAFKVVFPKIEKHWCRSQWVQLNSKHDKSNQF